MSRTTTRRIPRGLIVPVALIALVASSCGTDAAAPPTSSTPSIAPTDGAAPPVYSAVATSQQQIDDAVASLPRFVEDAMAETGVPGIAVAVVHDGELVLAQGFGVRDVTTGEKVDADTAFQLASVSKSIGATTVAKQVGKGVIAWDDPIVANLPGFALSDPYVTAHVSYADLYAHRSGLPDHIGDTLEDLGYDRTEVLRRLRFAELAPFRTENHYTNFGLTAAAEAVANASGTTWEELNQTELYGPLGMTSTTSSYATFEAQTNRAALHVKDGDEWKQSNIRNADAQSAAGGVSSSARDVATWMQLLLDDGQHEGEPFIAPEALAETLAPHAFSAPPSSLSARPGLDALGFNTSTNSTARVVFSHSGAFAMGAGTTFSIVPSENLGIVVLTNGSPIGLAEAIGATFLDRALVGSVTQDWMAMYQMAFEPLLANPASITEPAPSDPAPASADETYVGTYGNDFYGPAVITATGSGLVLTLGPAATLYPLTHRDGNEFTWIAPGENSPGPSRVTFGGDAAGPATTVVIDALNGVPPLGSFSR